MASVSSFSMSSSTPKFLALSLFQDLQSTMGANIESAVHSSTNQSRYVQMEEPTDLDKPISYCGENQTLRALCPLTISAKFISEGSAPNTVAKAVNR